MRRRYQLACLLVAAAAAVDATQRGPEGEVIASDTYFTPEIGEIRLLGACDVHPDSLVCWGSNGRVDKDLAKRVTEVILKSGEGPRRNGTAIPYRLGRKNRVAVFQIPTSVLRKPYPWPFLGLEATNHEYGPGGNHLSVINGGFTTECIPLEADLEAKTASVFARLLLSIGHSMDIPLKVGSTGTERGITITFDAIKEVKAHVRMARSKGANRGPLSYFVPTTWTLPFKVTGENRGVPTKLDVDFLDLNGDVIRMADSSGRPQKAIPGHVQPTTQRGVFVAGQGTFDEPTPLSPAPGTSQAIRVPVDPKYVSALRVTFKIEKSVEFKDIPLDPKE